MLEELKNRVAALEALIETIQDRVQEGLYAKQLIDQARNLCVRLGAMSPQNPSLQRHLEDLEEMLADLEEETREQRMKEVRELFRKHYNPSPPSQDPLG
jgi:hypothetical protein